MRALGLAVDPTVGGSNYDVLTSGGAPTWPAATLWVPATTGQVDPGYEDTDRNDEVRGVRAPSGPYPFRSAPSATFSVRAYPALTRFLLARALGQVASTGTAPAAITSTASPLPSQTGKLPALHAYLWRDGQLDRIGGCVVESFQFQVGDNGDAMIMITARGLYQEDVVESTVATPTVDTSASVDPYIGITLKALSGTGTLTAIPCLQSFEFTFDNQIRDDDRWCLGANVMRRLVNSGAAYRYRQYPNRHPLGRPTVTAEIQFGEVQPTFSERRRLLSAEKLVVEITGNPIPGTTPAADELMRVTFYRSIVTGGAGAAELKDEGEIGATWEIGGFLDPSVGKQFDVQFVGATALTV